MRAYDSERPESECQDDDYTAFMSLFIAGNGSNGAGEGSGDKGNSDGYAGDQGEQEHDDADSDGEEACANHCLSCY